MYPERMYMLRLPEIWRPGVEPQPCTHLPVLPTAFPYSLLSSDIISSINLFNSFHYMSFNMIWLTVLMIDCLFRILVHVQQFRSCSAIPQLLSNSAVVQRFRSLFVVCYTPRVFSRNEPHGHVGMDVYMDRMLLVGPNQSHMPPVNAGVPTVKQLSSRRWHGSAWATETRNHSWHFLHATKTTRDRIYP